MELHTTLATNGFSIYTLRGIAIMQRDLTLMSVIRCCLRWIIEENCFNEMLNHLFSEELQLIFIAANFFMFLTKLQHHFAGIKMNPSILKKCHCNWRLLIKYCEPKSHFKFSSSHYLFSGFPVIQSHLTFVASESKIVYQVSHEFATSIQS